MAQERYPHIDHTANQTYQSSKADEGPVVEPLGLVLFRSLWEGTKGTLTVDLARPTVPRQGAARSSLLRIRKAEEGARYAPPTRPGSGPQFTSRPAARPYAEDPLPVVPFMSTGARVKVMRHVELGPSFEGVKGTGGSKTFPAVDVGVGFSFELDTAELQPQARVKLWDLLSLRALPRPSLKLSKRLAVMGGKEGWGVQLSYECPLELRALERFWEPPARLMVSLDNLGSRGLQLTQTGVDFNGNVSFADGNLMIRGSGHVDFPHQLPLQEGEPLVRYELRRLGLKANW